MGATVTQYPTPTLVSANNRTLSATASAAASNSKVSIPALTVIAVTRRFIPETTSSSTFALPAGGYDGTGWEMDTDIIPLSDAGVTRASTITINLRVQSPLASTFVPSAGLYIGSTFLGSASGASTALAANTAATITVTINVAAGTTIPANGRLQLAVNCTATNIDALNPALITLLYTNTGTSVSALTYTINAVRTGTDNQNSTQTASRIVSTTRSSSETTGSIDTGSRVSSTFRRSTDVNSNPVETASRVVTAPRTASETTTQVDAAARVSTDFRRSVDAATNPVDSAARAITKSITVSDSMTTIVDLAQKTITYGRTTREYFAPADPPVTVPDRAIRGYVRNSDGTIFYGGATVQLIRDSDGYICGTVTSSIYDGSYVFPRDHTDTATYHVQGFATVAGTPEQDITERGLVPV